MSNEMANNLEIGNLLGHYRILQKIGAGGMGEVYLAEDTRLLRKIALKVLPENIAKDKDRLSRFEQEAFEASALNHPNILTIHEFGVENGVHFLAVELVEGKTLREWMKRQSFDLLEILDVAAQVAAALNAAHIAKIIHRDIKPENIMLRDDGLVKVLDFGLAKLTEKKNEPVESEDATRAQVKTAPGMVMGTVNYMSPEQARGIKTDARSDIWSLGVVLYEMLAARTPFAEETATDTIAAILKSEPAPLAENTPPELNRIVRKALQKNSDERYQTIKDFLLDLKNLKRELEFAEEIERSHIPPFSKSSNVGANQSSKNATAIQATDVSTQNSLPHSTASSAEYIASKIKIYKLGFASVLLILLAGAVGFGVWFFGGRATNAKQIESIAVLPFANESGNTDNEYLSDGMTESLISSLSQIPKLNVKARSSVFRYKGKETDLQKIGQELNVQAILSGHVTQRGDQLTLNLELVDAQTENVLWSEQYNRKQTDFVLLQNEIARDVSNKLRVKLSTADENRIAKNYTTNPEAYQSYLKGRYFLNQGTREGQIKSVEYFQQAVNLDSAFALGYAGMADAYTLLGTTFDASLKPREAMPKARIAAQKALEVEPNLSEAHPSLAWIKYRFDWDWRGAEEEFKQAIALNPNNAQAHHWYADYLVAMGRFDELLAEIKRARELDPFSVLINWNVGRILYFARRYDEALIELRKMLEMDPNSLRIHSFLERVYAMKGMNEEAFAEHLKYDALTGTSDERITNLKKAYAATGWKGVWQKEIEWALEDSKSRYVSPYSMAQLYSSLGDKDRTMEWLNKAYEERNGTLVVLKIDPSWENLRDDSRFQELLRKVGFP